MSQFTTEVRYICETFAECETSEDRDKVNEVIAKSRDKIFDFDFPIFDETYRGVLETKILRHYYTREIGFETVGLWKLKLETKLNEIMPYYNQLYKSELLDFNPLYDVDLTRQYNKLNSEDNSGQSKGDSQGEYTGTGSTSNSSSGSDSSTQWSKFSDTPQGAITGLDEDNYMSSATKNTIENERSDSSSGTSSDSSTNTGHTENNFSSKMSGTEDYVEHVKGANGGVSMSKRVMEFRKTFLNIDREVIDELKDLFFYLW